MKTLLIICLLSILLGTACIDYEPDPGYEEEPGVKIVFENNTKNFVTQSASKNKPKMNVAKNDFPGIDMNANSTKFWITQSSGIDSFTLNYKLFTFTKSKENWIQFDTVYLSQSSFKNAKLTTGNDTFLLKKDWYNNLILYVKE